jgi:hypothetical protein
MRRRGLARPGPVATLQNLGNLRRGEAPFTHLDQGSDQDADHVAEERVAAHIQVDPVWVRLADRDLIDPANGGSRGAPRGAKGAEVALTHDQLGRIAARSSAAPGRCQASRRASGERDERVRSE